MNTVRVGYVEAQCPISNDGVGRCASRATVTVKVGEFLGVCLLLTTCPYHADLVETDD